LLEAYFKSGKIEDVLAAIYKNSEYAWLKTDEELRSIIATPAKAARGKQFKSRIKASIRKAFIAI
jgi:hypothetical protein